LETQEDMFQNGYSNLISVLEKNNLNIVFVIDPPELGRDPSSCFTNRPFQFTNISAEKRCSQSLNKVLNRQLIYRKLASNLKRSHPNIRLYDPLPIFCNDITCYGMRNNNLYYWDNNHISTFGSLAILNDMRYKGYF
jgi:hypothetical protein